MAEHASQKESLCFAACLLLFLIFPASAFAASSVTPPLGLAWKDKRPAAEKKLTDQGFTKTRKGSFTGKVFGYDAAVELECADEVKRLISVTVIFDDADAFDAIAESLRSSFGEPHSIQNVPELRELNALQKSFRDSPSWYFPKEEKLVYVTNFSNSVVSLVFLVYRDTKRDESMGWSALLWSMGAAVFATASTILFRALKHG